MRIRTRLLLFLLPTFIGSIALISSLLAYHWHANLTSLTAADVSLGLIDTKFKESLLLILFSAGFTIIVMVATLYVIANNISRPVQKLNNSALAIAAGQYGESIEVQGPKEIAELANTLNTMSQCLHENINRLRENSLMRERMYGEYECSMLLQHLMLQKNIENCRSDTVAVKSITYFSENPKGLLLDFPKSDCGRFFHIHMVEAEEEGLEGMYQLLTHYKSSIPRAVKTCTFGECESSCGCTILNDRTSETWSDAGSCNPEALGQSKGAMFNHTGYKTGSSGTLLTIDKTSSVLQSEGPLTPLIWSLEKRKFIENDIEPGDFFFLFNLGFAAFYQDRQKIEELLTKVLKIFAQDGLETTVSMLQKEVGFAMKRKDSEEDIHLLCFQILHL